MRRSRMAALLLALVVLLLAGCAPSPAPPAAPQLADRGGIEGAGPDLILDVTYVEVYRNIDHFPNIAKICVHKVAFAVPSTGAGASVGATPIVRVPEWDADCAAREPTEPKAPGAPAN